MRQTFHQGHDVEVLFVPGTDIASGGADATSKEIVNAHEKFRKLTFALTADLTAIDPAADVQVEVSSDGSSFANLQDAQGVDLPFDLLQTIENAQMDATEDAPKGVLIGTVALDRLAFTHYRVKVTNNDAGQVMEIGGLAILSDPYTLPVQHDVDDQLRDPILRPT